MNSDQLAPYLTRYPEIFTLLDPTVVSQMTIITFKHQDKIVSQGTALSQLFFILDGKAKIYLTEENGRRNLLQFLFKGSWIGELTVVEGESEVKDVISIGSTTCLAIPMTVVKDSLMTDLTFVKMIATYIARNLLLRVNHFSKNQAYELKNRLATFILAATNDDLYQEKHTEVAEYLGVSYRHLLHTFKSFKDQGYIKKVDKGYQIERELLEALEIFS